MIKVFIETIRNGSWLNERRVRDYPRLFLLLFLLGGGVFLYTSSGGHDPYHQVIGADFINVYAAGKIVRQGDASRVYDPDYQHEVEKEIAGPGTGYYGWHYPPPFLAVARLLASLPYGPALTLYLITSFSLLFVVLGVLTSWRPQALWAIASFPAMFINAANGQNGFLTAALTGAGFLFLQRSPWLSGLFFGLIAYKPHFFLLIPLILFCGRYYKAAFACGLSACVGGLLSWLWLGLGPWIGFLHDIAYIKRVVLESGHVGWEKIESVFSIARRIGIGQTGAYALHNAIALIVLLAVLILWRNRTTSLEDKGSVLCFAALLTTPYVLDYDLVLLAVPLVFLTSQGLKNGFSPYEKTLLALLWLWPLLARIFATAFFPFTPFLLLALLSLCWRRTKRETLSRQRHTIAA